MNVELSAEKKREMRERLRGYLVERLGSEAGALEEGERLLAVRDEMEKEQSDSIASSSTRTSTASAVSPTTIEASKSPAEISRDRSSGILATHGPWIALIDPKRGMIYYHNQESNITSWNRPSDFPFIKLSAKKRRELQEINRRYLEWRKEGTVNAVKKVSVLGKGVVTVKSTSKEIGNELDSLDRIQKDIDARLSQVIKTDGNTQSTQKRKEPIYKQEEWAAYLDDKSGLVYYFNEVEKTSVWDPPSEDFLERVRERMMDGSVKFDNAVVKESNGVTKDGSTYASSKVVVRDVNGAVAKEVRTNVSVEVKAEKSLFFIQDADETLVRSPVDYDAAARLAYDESKSGDDFDAFKTNYLLETSNMVGQKHIGRMEEAARIANELKAEQEKILEEEMRLSR